MTSPDVPIIYVILLAWNDRSAVMRCLQSIQATVYPNLQVLVVDNASKDDTVVYVKNEFSDYRVIENSANLGFGAGCNVGLRLALDEEADFVFLINQDCIIDSDLFNNLIQAAQDYPEAGIFGPKTYFLEENSADPQKLLYAGSWRGRLPLQQDIPGIEMPDDGSYDQPCQVDFAWGHGLFVRGEVLRKIGLFDEAFFMYFEDMDLCYRACHAGYQIWYIPRALMWHELEDGARSANPELWRFKYKTDSMLAFYQKYYGLARGHILTGLHVLDEMRQMWRRGHKKGVTVLLQAWGKTLRYHE